MINDAIMRMNSSTTKIQNHKSSEVTRTSSACQQEVTKM